MKKTLTWALCKPFLLPDFNSKLGQRMRRWKWRFNVSILPLLRRLGRYEIRIWKGRVCHKEVAFNIVASEASKAKYGYYSWTGSLWVLCACVTCCFRYVSDLSWKRLKYLFLTYEHINHSWMKKGQWFKGSNVRYTYQIALDWPPKKVSCRWRRWYVITPQTAAPQTRWLRATWLSLKGL